ncbi:acyl-coenzyme A thioesterase 13 isoform X1 [Aphelocoma coerulescens]|uniref:acyl-coenzyme A thioesterase 13 isoform X1 n=1 Tax=Aphelocoma coerulescens TaxID=39617 RepID=UPI0036053398
MGFTVESLKEAMKYMVESQGFDRVLRKMKLQSATPGKVVCEMKVEEEHTNRGGTLHGGLTATLVDVVSTAALLYTERAVPGVSVDMNITSFQEEAPKVETFSGLLAGTFQNVWPTFARTPLPPIFADLNVLQSVHFQCLQWVTLLRCKLL